MKNSNDINNKNNQMDTFAKNVDANHAKEIQKLKEKYLKSVKDAISYENGFTKIENPRSIGLRTLSGDLWSTELLADKEVVLTAMRVLGAEEFFFASAVLKSDKGFILDALKEFDEQKDVFAPSIFAQADYLVRCDKELVLEIASIGIVDTYSNVGDVLKQDKEVFLKYLEKTNSVNTLIKNFRNASFVLRNDPEIVEAYRNKSIAAYLMSKGSDAIKQDVFAVVEKSVNSKNSDYDTLYLTDELHKFVDSLGNEEDWLVEDDDLKNIQFSLDYIISKMNLKTIDEEIVRYSGNKEFVVEALKDEKLRRIEMNKETKSENLVKSKSSRKIVR